MAKHIWINPERVQNAKSLRIGGVKFSVSISPFDTPKEIIGQYDVSTGLFSISFKYDDSEPVAKAATSPDGVEFFEGKHSGKLMRIVVPVDKNNLAIVALQTKVMKALVQRRQGFDKNRSFVKDLNQTVAEEVLALDFNRFESELVGAAQ